MLALKSLAQCLLIIACSYPCVLAQAARASEPAPAEIKKADEANAQKTTDTANQPPPETIIVLIGGREIIADEVNESSDGYWYKRGNVSTFLDRAKVERVTRPVENVAASAQTTLQGNGRWHLVDADKVKDFFSATFNRPLPLSSFGQSDIHNRWGLDHRNGMDVNLHPDSPEGRALIVFLRAESIPFLVFRSAIPRVATGPHIHVGNPSPRVVFR